MIVKYDDGLKNQTFLESAEFLCTLGIIEKYNNGEYLTLGNIENPILAFDAQGINSLKHGDLITELFHHPQILLTTEYDGTMNNWYKSKGTWPASIDTLIHLEGQRKSESLKQANTVLDVACGTGMAGAYAANKNPNIEHLLFSDINPYAVNSALRNGDLLDRKNIVWTIVNDALKDIDQKYDVIIASAIPTTPSYPGMQRPINPLFEGTQLLEDLLKDAPKRLNEGGKLIISHSNLGDAAFDEFAKKYGAKVDKILNEKLVPFRVEFLGDQDWVRYLVHNHGMHHVNSADSRGHPYWHIQRVKEISFS